MQINGPTLLRKNLLLLTPTSTRMNQASLRNIFLLSRAKATDCRLPAGRSHEHLYATHRSEDLSKFFKRWITTIPAATSIFMKFVLRIILGKTETEQEHTTDKRSTTGRGL
jgi:hypothetical protein